MEINHGLRVSAERVSVDCLLKHYETRQTYPLFYCNHAVVKKDEKQVLLFPMSFVTHTESGSQLDF